MGIKKGYGFTLIETLVVIAVIAIVLPSVFAIIFGIVQQQTKIFRLSQVKREGDYLLNIIENNLRNDAISIHSGYPGNDSNERCLSVENYTSTTGLYFLNSKGSTFGYILSDNQISSKSSDLSADVALNSDKTIISDFNISCDRTAIYSSPTVSINFDICYDTGLGNCTSTRPEETASLNYQTSIKLR